MMCDRMYIILPESGRAFPGPLDWIQSEEEWTAAKADPTKKCFIQGCQKFSTSWKNWSLMLEGQIHRLWQERSATETYLGELQENLREEKEKNSILMNDPGAKALWKEHEKRLKVCNELGQLKTSHRKLEMSYMELTAKYHELQSRYGIQEEEEERAL